MEQGQGSHLEEEFKWANTMAFDEKWLVKEINYSGGWGGYKASENGKRRKKEGKRREKREKPAVQLRHGQPMQPRD